jgi:hypothetical protein
MRYEFVNHFQSLPDREKLLEVFERTFGNRTNSIHTSGAGKPLKEGSVHRTLWELTKGESRRPAGCCGARPGARC